MGLAPHARNYWIDNLRSAITVLVLAHHATLAYTTFARFEPSAYINSTHPIVDNSRWIGLDIFQNFNDIFFMSLMFLISGLFVSISITKKGTRFFIRDRFYRLFVPFVFVGTFFMLLAHFPAFYVANQDTNLWIYIKDFFTTQRWPVGPPWFIWVLFAFNLLLASLYKIVYRVIRRCAIYMNKLSSKPYLFIVALLTITWILYVPLAYYIGAGTWTGFGPFDFQLSRMMLYFGYFMLGVIFGTIPFNDTLFSQASPLVKKWKIWLSMAFILYALLTVLTEFKLLDKLASRSVFFLSVAWLIYYGLYVSCCVFSCMAAITSFKLKVSNTSFWWKSLSANAYLIYLIHYVFIIWSQFLLMETSIPAFAKFLIVFLPSLAASWIASTMLRKITILKRYL